MMRRTAAVMAAFLSLIFVLLSVPVAGAEENEESVRVGVMLYSGFVYEDSADHFRGYDVEYLYKIAQYARLKIRFVPLKKISDALEKLRSGEIDMLLDFVKTAEREKEFLFSENELMRTSSTIYVRHNETRYEYGNVAQLSGMKIAAMRGSYATQNLISWSEEHKVSPQILQYDSIAAMDTALECGDVDALVMGNEAHAGFRIIMRFAPCPSFILFRKDRSAVKEKVDSAMRLILSQDPLYEQSLINEHVATVTRQVNALTKAEKEYIQRHPVLRVAVTADDAPYFRTGAGGRQSGIIPDYYAQLSAFLGVTFVFRPCRTGTEAMASVLNGESDILGLYTDDIVFAAEHGFAQTNSFSSMDLVRLTRVDSVPSITAAVLNRNLDVIRRKMAAVSQGADFYPFADVHDCYAAIRDGRAGSFICDLPTAVWLVNQHRASNYAVTAIMGLRLDLRSAVAWKNQLLCSILDKSITATCSSLQSIIAVNTVPENDLRGLVERLPVKWLAVFGLSMLLCILSLVAALFLLKRRQTEKAAVEAVKAENERRKLKLTAAEKINEEKSNFFSNISHDMRTPLNAIIGFSELAKKQPLSSQLSDYLSKILSSGRLLQELIDDTLTLSKINSGKLQLIQGTVNLGQMLDSVIVPIRESAQNSNLIFTVDIHSVSDRAIIADALNLKKILLNLLSNSVKYTPSGGTVCLTISAVPSDRGLALTVVVKDTGIGISEDFLPHIYEPFAQEGRAVRESAGTGLGLSIVKRLVTLMDGKISVQSKIGCGTTFTVQFCFKEAAAVPEQKPDVETRHCEFLLRGKKVLLCEDNALNREVAVALLESEGMIVIPAVNGREGVEIFRSSAEGEFSAVLMDIRMPVMDGYQATREIRALNRTDAGLPILAMTAATFEEDRRKCFDAGMDGHIAKPFDPVRVFALLDDMLSGKRPQERDSQSAPAGRL